MEYRVEKPSPKHTRYYFDSLGAFTRQSQVKNPSAKHDASRTNGDGWAGASMVDSVKMVNEGWPEGRGKLAKAMAEVSTTPNMMASLSMDVAGAYPVAALAAAGDPCSMVDLQPIEDRVRPIVRLIVARVASAFYGANEFMNYGVAVLSYIEGLEANGFRVELECSMTCTMDGGEAVDTRILVKRAEEPMELDRLAFALAHPAFFRRIGFAVWESIPEIDCILGWGYGSPRSLEACELDENQIALPGVNILDQKSLKTPKKALEVMAPMIEQQLKNAGLAPPPVVFEGKANA